MDTSIEEAHNYTLSSLIPEQQIKPELGADDEIHSPLIFLPI